MRQIKSSPSNQRPGHENHNAQWFSSVPSSHDCGLRSTRDSILSSLLSTVAATAAARLQSRVGLGPPDRDAHDARGAVR
jgi:hypothetical protein